MDFGKKELTYAIIANNSFISWEGTIVNAKLYTHPFIKSFLENILLPLQDYLKQVGNASRVSLDYPTVFEWMFLKRFQEIFSKNQQPSKVQPLFFNTPVFGSLCGLAFSSTTRLIPKITKNGNQTADLDSETAHPNNWQSLIRQIDELSDVCLKPRSKSASSDAFLISEATSKNEMVKVTVGLAVKNFNSAKFTTTHLEKECDLFNRMFDGTDCQRRRNILFICCTNYHKDISSQFRDKLFHVFNCALFENIHEVVLLDLTNDHNRCRFFDVNDSLLECVENVVRQSEVELND